MQLIILDIHPMNDGRIERHIKYCLSLNIPVIHIHFNRSELNLSPGIFSQFGEQGFRIKIAGKTTSIKNNPIYFNFFCVTPLIINKAKKALKLLRIDTSIPTILHVHDPAVLNLALVLKRYFFSDAKLVYDRHEIYETKFSFLGVKLPRIARFYEILAKGDIDGIVSVSEAHHLSIQALFPGIIIATVPNYPSLSEYNNKIITEKIKNFRDNEATKLVYIGSLANKNDRDIDLLLHIYENVLRKYPNIICYIGGQCNDIQLKNKFLMLNHDFGDRFKYLGRITRAQTIDLTSRSHIGFFLIRPETQYWVRCSPNKVFEYLICGVFPIIRADIDCAQNFKNCSLLFHRDTEKEEILKEVIDFLNEPNLIKNMMENALTLSREFTFESVSANYLEIYKYLLQKKL